MESSESEACSGIVVTTTVTSRVLPTLLKPCSIEATSFAEVLQKLLSEGGHRALMASSITA